MQQRPDIMRLKPRFLKTQSATLGCVSVVIMVMVAVTVAAWTEVSQASPIPFGRVLPDTPEEIAFWDERFKIIAGGQHLWALSSMERLVRL